MKNYFTILLSMVLGGYSFTQDWANLNKYKDENAKLGLPFSNESRIVFMGNSITEGWSKFSPEFFVGKQYINRGISGQTTPQMLVRFRQDVINLKPLLVVILAGTNDIAENTGPTTLEMIAGNIFSMAELANKNGIKVILCSVLPVSEYPWKRGLNPIEKIFALNEMIKNYALQNGFVYLDYYSLMVDEQKGLKKEYSEDGVHPTEAGYKIMEPPLEEAITRALDRK